MTNQNERLWRMNEILAMIPTHEIDREDFISKMMVRWGLSRRILTEYLKALKSNDMIRGWDKIWKPNNLNKLEENYDRSTTPKN